jgi:alkanesulfonate monooxygenase SsuD/methylene tetrahydromethanopterin reductase-like flavin-dependent oxidoreductase (luciferase family)
MTLPEVAAPRVHIGINLSPQGVDWSTLEAAWARVGRHDVFESVWTNDHLTDVGLERNGASWDTVTATAALAHHVPGRTIGHGVLANTFRHPAVLAKQATILDHITGGRYVLGLGAGWHAGEHESLGIPLPPIRERFDRFESAVHVLRALFSAEAVAPPGVTLEDPFYPLRGATNEPPPLTTGGPPLWLGGQRTRGIRLAARYGAGWILPSFVPGVVVDVEYFRDRRAALIEALRAEGRDPAGFSFAAKLGTGRTAADREAAVRTSHEYVRAGATHILLSVPPALGPDGVDAAAAEVAVPLREQLG